VGPTIVAATRIQFKTNPGVACGDAISSTFDSNVVAGNRILVRLASYNSAEITAGMVTDSQTHSYTLHRQRSNGFGFSIAILSTVAASSAALTVTGNVTGTNDYALYIEEWSGLLDVVDHVGDSASSATALAGTLEASVSGYAFAFMSHASDTTSLTPDAGWTRDAELESNDSTLCYNAMSRETVPGLSYDAEWALGGASGWIAVAIIFEVEAGEPEILYESERTGTGPAAVQSSTLRFVRGTPQVGDTIVVAISGPWMRSASPHGTTPVSGQISDNQGGSAGKYIQAGLMDSATESRTDTGNNEQSGLGIFYRRVTDAVVGHFDITFDCHPGGSNDGYWSWAIYSIPGIVTSSPVNAVSKAWRPAPGATSMPVALIPFGTCTPTKTRTLAIYIGHNAFHEAELDVEDPIGYTVVLHNEENSNYLAGHSGFKVKDGDTSAEAPTMPITILTGVGAMYSAGLLVLFELEGGAVVAK
jgi:hypothetical protein